MSDIATKTPDEVWQEVWLPILQEAERKAGEERFYHHAVLTAPAFEQLKKELYDFHYLIREASLVYCEVTGGRISKPNTKSYEVINQAEEIQQELMLEAQQELLDVMYEVFEVDLETINNVAEYFSLDKPGDHNKETT
jgi:hypothetical protein